MNMMYRSFRLVQDGHNNDSNFSFEKNFPVQMSVDKLKERLEVIVGIAKDDINVDLCNLDGSLITKFDDPKKLLNEYYDFKDNKQLLLKIISDKRSILDNFDTSENAEINEDDVESRFKLTEEQYEKRPDTIRKFKQQNNITEQTFPSRPTNTETIIKRLYVGQRCLVKSPGKTDRLGTIRYMGTPENSDLYRVGVEFDHYLGIHDGSYNGIYYFKCEPKKGSYILPEFVFPLESQDEVSNQEDVEEF